MSSRLSKLLYTLFFVAVIAFCVVFIVHGHLSTPAASFVALLAVFYAIAGVLLARPILRDRPWQRRAR